MNVIMLNVAVQHAETICKNLIYVRKNWKLLENAINVCASRGN